MAHLLIFAVGVAAGSTLTWALLNSVGNSNRINRQRGDTPNMPDEPQPPPGIA